MFPHHHIRRQHNGISLVEILVTTVIISVGLLGVAALHTLSLRNNYEARVDSQATTFVQDIVDRMSANQTEARKGNYDIAIGATVTMGTPPTVRDSDLDAWKKRLKVTLPAGDGSIARVPLGSSQLFVVTISWTERGVGPVSFVAKVEI